MPKTYSKETIDNIARVCHEANRAYSFTLGDKDHRAYDEAPDYQKESSRNGVLFALENEKATPIDMHKSWFDEKVKAGWTYGEIKDETKKTHPSLLPFGDLPEGIRIKDSIFLAIVRAYGA